MFNFTNINHTILTWYLNNKKNEIHYPSKNYSQQCNEIDSGFNRKKEDYESLLHQIWNQKCNRWTDDHDAIEFDTNDISDVQFKHIREEMTKLVPTSEDIEQRYQQSFINMKAAFMQKLINYDKANSTTGSTKIKTHTIFTNHSRN